MNEGYDVILFNTTPSVMTVGTYSIPAHGVMPLTFKEYLTLCSTVDVLSINALVVRYGRLPKQGSISVRNFGAYGDGVHDDTEAVQKAIDFAHRNGVNTVSLPYGTYPCSGVALENGMRLLGDGAESTTLLGSLSAGADMVTGGAGCIVERLKVDGDDTAGVGISLGANSIVCDCSVLDCTGVSVNVGASSRVVGVSVSGGGAQGFTLAANTVLSESTVTDCVGSGVKTVGDGISLSIVDISQCYYGVEATNGANVHISGGSVHDNLRHGVYLSGISASIIDSNFIYKNSQTNTNTYSGIYINATVALPFTLCSIRGNRIGVASGEKHKYGIEMVQDTSSTALVTHLVSTSNTIIGYGTAAYLYPMVTDESVVLGAANVPVALDYDLYDEASVVVTLNGTPYTNADWTVSVANNTIAPDDTTLDNSTVLVDYRYIPTGLFSDYAV